MDIEALKSLAWIVIWGGFFFFMMRFGCGAHIGGHGHAEGHGGHDVPQPGGKAKDPVCGMDVEPQRARATSVYRGSTYYFCSTSCRDKFEQAPEKYAPAAAVSQPQPGGHHHA